MVMVWSEGGQGEVRGACPPPPPTPQIAPPGSPPPTTPICPTWTPPPQPTLPAPPLSPLLDPTPCRPSLNTPSQQLVGGVVGVQIRGVPPPPLGQRHIQCTPLPKPEVDFLHWLSHYKPVLQPCINAMEHGGWEMWMPFDK